MCVILQEVVVPLSSAGTRQGSVVMEVRVRKIPLVTNKKPQENPNPQHEEEEV